MQLIGRDHDLAEIGFRFAAGRRLVTVVGPGGIGETALARAPSAFAASTRAPGLVELFGPNHATDHFTLPRPRPPAVTSATAG